MVDKLFADPYLASLYDILCADRGDEQFYLDLIRSARTVLDVGCGTGALLHRARAEGHRGRLVGIDPGEGMLARARRRSDVEWVQGTMGDVARWIAEFDLVYMTGHAFQVLRTDDELRDGLAAVCDALAEGGRFAFETRNPLKRAWATWTPDSITEIRDENGAGVRVWHEVLSVDGELVSFTENFASDSWDRPLVSRSTLRFLPAALLDRFLADAGFCVDERYGDWDRSPFTPTAREIITVASVSQEAGRTRGEETSDADEKFRARTA